MTEEDQEEMGRGSVGSETEIRSCKNIDGPT